MPCQRKVTCKKSSLRFLTPSYTGDCDSGFMFVYIPKNKSYITGVYLLLIQNYYLGFWPRRGGNAGGGSVSSLLEKCSEFLGLRTDGAEDVDEGRGGNGGGASSLSFPSIAFVKSTLIGNDENVKLLLSLWGDLGGRGGGATSDRLWFEINFSDCCLLNIFSVLVGSCLSDEERNLRGGTCGAFSFSKASSFST